MEEDAERTRLDGLQWRLRRERDARRSAWLDELEGAPRPALVERALRKLGFRELERRDDAFLVVDGEERIPVTLRPAELARLVRARADADWSFADVRPLVRPGAGRVPARYDPLGRVVEHVGQLPEIRLDVDVPAGSTIAFEVGRSYREWIVEERLGYVGTPPPAVGAAVWLVADA